MVSSFGGEAAREGGLIEDFLVGESRHKKQSHLFVEFLSVLLSLALDDLLLGIVLFKGQSDSLCLG